MFMFSSIASVIVTVFLLFYFRKNVKQVAQETEKTLDHLTFTIGVASEQLENAAVTYGAASQAELQKTLKEAQDEIAKLGGPVNFREAYANLTASVPSTTTK